MEQPTIDSMILVVGASEQEEFTELLLEDDGVHVVPSELLLAALPEGSSGTEAFFAKRDKTALKMICKGTEVSAIELEL